MNKVFLPNVSDLAEAPRASYYRFLLTGITDELSTFPNPLTKTIGNKEKKIFLLINQIKVGGPSFDPINCLQNDRTYSIQLYIIGEHTQVLKTKNVKKFLRKLKRKKCNFLQNILNKKKKFLRLQKKYPLAEVPFLTEEGTFIINGCERIIVSQVIRSPGIYFQKEFLTNQMTLYTATIISNTGIWSKIVFDEVRQKEDDILNPENKKGDLLYERVYMTFTTLSDKASQTKRQKEDEEETDEEKFFIYDLIRYFGLTLEEIADNLAYPDILLNQQLIRKENPNSEFISEDLSGLYFERLELINCFSIGKIGRYQVNRALGLNLNCELTYLTALDFLKILDELIKLKYYGRESDDIDHIRNKQIRSIGDFLQNQFRIGLYRLQKMSLKAKETEEEQAKIAGVQPKKTPLEKWMLLPRVITTALKEFFKASELAQYMDQTNPLAEISHKRRLSVFGPNGLNRDHVSTKIRDIHPSQYGKICPIETPEGQNTGVITSLSMFGRINSLGWIETPYFFLNEEKEQLNKQAVYLNPEQESRTKIAFCDISLTSNYQLSKDNLSAKENYSFSILEKSKVDFLTISPLQLLSLATSLIPFVEHDDANRALMGANMQRQAVPLLCPQPPIVGTGFETSAVLDSSLVIKNYCEGKVRFSSAEKIIIEDNFFQSISYYLKKYLRSNQETVIVQKPLVWNGEIVFSGQLIADGPGTQEGELALGKNLVIAYMPWEGYNYEDAIVINERLVIDDCLTSIHIEEHETMVGWEEKITCDVPGLTEYVRRHLTKEGIVQVGSYVSEDDILVGKTAPGEEDFSPEGRLLKALYGRKEPPERNTSLRVPHGTEGCVIDVHSVFSGSLNEEEPIYSMVYQTIRISIAQVRKIQVGDKLSGRHGNKGVISRILPQQDMPFLPDGTTVDLMVNPLGVPSRMNVGQLFECLLGLAGEHLGKRFKVSPFDEVYGEEASRVFVNQKLKEAALKTNIDWLYDSSFPGKIFLRDGRTGEYFDNPITVGRSYILKLIHLVEDKIHTRAIGPYAMITEQPLAGKAQNGGQRFGEMEVWALEAHGCSTTLQELMTIKSDDIDGRNDMYEAILLGQKMKKPVPSIPESFLTLVRELNALGLDFCVHKIEENNEVTIHNQNNIHQIIERDLFLTIEERLRLRSILSRSPREKFLHSTELNLEKKKLIQKFKEKNEFN